MNFLKLEQDGFIHLNNIYENNVIDELLVKINNFRNNTPDYGNNNKHNNLGNRIGRLHYSIKEYYNLLLNSTVFNVIKEILNKPVLMGSLTFENGSSQSAHIDNWFFYTKPENGMIGIWIALEDITEDQGPLFYYENSHKLDSTDPSKFNHDELNTSEVGNKLSEDLSNKTSLLTKKLVIANKGDIFIWRYNLVHGGEKILNLNKTRNSIVFHLIDYDANLFSYTDYMLYGKNIEDKYALKQTYFDIEELKVCDFGAIEYINNKIEYSKIIT